MTSKNSTKNFWWIAASAAIAAVFLLPFVLPDYRMFLERIIRTYPASAPLVIITTRFIGFVIAPISGSPVMFASIALLPWPQAFLYNFIGSYLGGLTAFFIARHYRERVVSYFAPLERIREWQSRVSARRQFWAFVGLRFVSASAADFVSYAAGLTSLPARSYILATLLVDLPIMFAFFYLGGIAIRYSLVAFFAFALILGVSGTWLGVFSQKRS